MVRTIHNSPLFKKPDVGNNQFQQVEKEKLGGDIDMLQNVLKTIAALQGTSARINVNNVIAKLVISHSLFNVAMIKLKQLGYADWDNLRSGDYVKATENGFLYAYENGLLK